jgi:hypothetical protein
MSFEVPGSGVSGTSPRPVPFMPLTGVSKFD